MLLDGEPEGVPPLSPMTGKLPVMRQEAVSTFPAFRGESGKGEAARSVRNEKPAVTARMNIGVCSVFPRQKAGSGEAGLAENTPYCGK